MKKRLSKDTIVVIGFIAILIVMIFVSNTGITGQPWISFSKPGCKTNADCGTSGWIGTLFCSGNNLVQVYRNAVCVKGTFRFSNKCKVTTSTRVKMTCPSGTICKDKDGTCIKDTRCYVNDQKKCINNNHWVNCGRYASDGTLMWSPIPVICPFGQMCSNGKCIPGKCSDGTLYGACSTTKPKVCDNNGNLINMCSKCGCPNNQLFCLIDGSCSNDCGRKKVAKIAIVEFIPENIEDKFCDLSGNCYSFIEILNNKNQKEFILKDNNKEYKFYSFYSINDWFKRESERYNVKMPIETIVTYGPYKTNTIPPEPIESSYFIEESKKNDLELSNYDLIAYFYFSKGGEFAFRSRASKSKNEVYINLRILNNVKDMSEESIYSIFTLIHEILHTQCATDKFEDNPIGFAGCMGWIDPNQMPLYPQHQAEIMCTRAIPISSKVVINIRDLIDLKISESTAREIGWINKPIRCYNDRDCGENSFIEYCKDKIVYTDEGIKCNNPGTIDSYCSYTPKKINECQVECTIGGQCDSLQLSTIKCSNTGNCILYYAGFCSEGVCKKCVVDSECGDGFYCLEGLCFKSTCKEGSFPESGCWGYSACINGKCAPCTKDSDCGINHYSETINCIDGVRFKTYYTYKCINAGKIDSKCFQGDDSTKKQIIETCTNGCGAFYQCA